MSGMTNSWRLFDVPPMFITIGVVGGERRELSVPHLSQREIAIIGRTMMLAMERRLQERRAAK